MPSTKPCANQAKHRLKNAPNNVATVKMELALKRSAKPVNAIKKVPMIKPACTALVSQPISATVMCHSRIKSSAALLALNHNDVPKS